MKPLAIQQMEGVRGALMRVDSEQMGRQPQRTSHSDNSYIKGWISRVNTINK